MLTPRELVQKLWDAGEYSDSGFSLDEIMAYADEDCSWFETAIPKTGIADGDYYPHEFDGASGYRIVFARESEKNYIFTCYRY